MSDLNTKIPPQNLEAEVSILGGILLDNSAFDKCTEIISPDDFYRNSHRKIFKTMSEMSGRGDPIDLLVLGDALKILGILNECGGPAYIASLADGVPTAANIKYYCRIIKDAAVCRGLITAGQMISEEGYSRSMEVEEFIDFAEQSIFKISEKKIKPSFSAMPALIKNGFQTIEQLYSQKESVTGVSSGFKDLDDMLAGFQPSDLVIIAGRPSMGKTAFCLNIAVNALPDFLSESVAIFSLEMSEEQLLLRMICSEAKVDFVKLRKGMLSESDWPKLTRAAGRLKELPLFIDDTPALSVLEVRARARRLKAEKGLSMVIIDYMQLMRGKNGSENRNSEISEISRGLKALAKELSVPVIALSQLSRSVEQRGGDKRPMLSDLRDSGSIEQDADVVMFVYREEVYKPQDTSLKGLAEIIVAKQRNGPTGPIKLTWLDYCTRFENHTVNWADHGK